MNNGFRGVTAALGALALLTTAGPSAQAGAADTYCQYRTTEGRHLLTENWSQGDWLASGVLVVHATGTVVNKYRYIRVSATGATGWWGGGLQRTSAPCWN
ncbi:hypothetical protein N8J89_16440 [Crossiella sp. CA-258035]|uniref:hypothetical protein n=1 Tax=Crossiella sp. CA-258035 TaxID=2981138 RepID=UPI0024BCC7C8|nr:hypothetical protein [Crossiella sp. CA-258035]WHT22588.1 hypothetical protein N8J89_16440 [Crossiella sp. CA-258035]